MTETLWTDAEVTAATGGAASAPFAATGLSIDTRTLRPGDLYVALGGPNHDGHDFIAAARQAGAIAALVSRATDNALPLVRIADTMQALNQLAVSARKRSNAIRLAVTGSVGKTTTKEMLRHIFSADAATHATIGNLNNAIGTPLSLARMSADTRYAVFEMGMDHAGEIAPLSELVQPLIALITTIGVAHMLNFADGQPGIARAKAEIFTGLEQGGTAILPRDDPFFDFLADVARARGAAHILGFGLHPEADARLLDQTESEVSAIILGQPVRFSFQVPGTHMVLNALAAVLGAQAAGLAAAKAAETLGAFTALKGRGRQHKLAFQGGSITVIDDCYNANPQSMLAAIAVLSQTAGQRRIAVLGDMLELGPLTESAHADLAGPLQKAGITSVFCAGPSMKYLYDALPASLQGAYAASAGELAPLVAAQLAVDDVILIKGSRGAQVNINGVMSPSMAVITAAIETAALERRHHAV